MMVQVYSYESASFSSASPSSVLPSPSPEVSDTSTITKSPTDANNELIPLDRRYATMSSVPANCCVLCADSHIAAIAAAVTGDSCC